MSDSRDAPLESENRCYQVKVFPLTSTAKGICHAGLIHYTKGLQSCCLRKILGSLERRLLGGCWHCPGSKCHSWLILVMGQPMGQPPSFLGQHQGNFGQLLYSARALPPPDNREHKLCLLRPQPAFVLAPTASRPCATWF